MIKIEEKNKCCGCHACFNICPRNAIEMVEDEKGFKYPKINENKCINCRLCEKVCPILNKNKISNNPRAYACINKNEDIRENSSSGGIFTLIAEEIINRGGVIFGAQFDNDFNVIHSYTSNEEELYKFRGSKYVQSIIGDNYKIVKRFLEEGKYVLFTGTPCQVYGLYAFLQKNYDKLYTQDIICHGVPSPKVWGKYLQFREKKDKNKPNKISFRNKDNGWINYNVKFNYGTKEYRQKNSNELFIQAFLRNTILRDSCYNCHFKGKDRISDITLADFWGIDNIVPEMNDNKGTSLIIINSEKGQKLFEKIEENTIAKEVDIEEAIKYNPSMIQSSNKDIKREKFFENLDKMNFNKLVNKYTTKPNFCKLTSIKVKSIVKSIINKITKM